MTQPELDFRTPPRTHTGDPATSHRAEERLRKSGKLSEQQSVILDWLRLRPGSAASQIAHVRLQAFSSNHTERLYQVRRRLSDLKAAGLVRRQAIRGQRESRWFVVEQP